MKRPQEHIENCVKISTATRSGMNSTKDAPRGSLLGSLLLNIYFSMTASCLLKMLPFKMTSVIEDIQKSKALH